MGITFPLAGVLGEDKAQGKVAEFEYGLYNKRILVTGANGQLGNEMRKLAANYTQYIFDFTDIDELDLTNKEDVLEYCQRSMPAFIVNCAAYTAVDKAEDDKEICFKINSIAVENLSLAAVAVNALLIHISTDYVFDGTAVLPYLETDKTNPVSVYGASKLEGELNVQQICKKYVILRTSWLYSEFGNNFVKTMLRLGREKESLNVVADQKGSPTYAADLAIAVMQVIEKSDSGHLVSGIFNYSNEGSCTWYEFTKSIHKIAGITGCTVNPVSSNEYPSKVARPAYSILSKEKIKNTYGIIIPHWEESLAVCISKIK